MTQQPAVPPDVPSGPPYGPAPVLPDGSWVPPPGLGPGGGEWRTRRVEPVAGTRYGLVHLEVAAVTSGLALGALVAGIAAILISLVVGCLGLLGAAEGWGAWAGGAFTILAFAAGGAGLGLGVAARRQIRRSEAPERMRFTGRGVAFGGIVCAVSGMALALLTLLFALAVQA